MSTDLRHPDFNMRINEDPLNGAMCVIGFHFLPPGEKRVSTYIGTSGQNDICMTCVEEAALLLKKQKREAVV